MVTEIEKTREKIASEIGGEISKILKDFTDEDISERAILATKLFPLFMRSYEMGKKEGKEEAKKEFIKKWEEINTDPNNIEQSNPQYWKWQFISAYIRELELQLKTDSSQSTKDEEVKE